MDNWKILGKPLGYKYLLANKTQNYSDEFKKKMWNTRLCKDFQHCKKIIAEELAVHFLIDNKSRWTLN